MHVTSAAVTFIFATAVAIAADAPKAHPAWSLPDNAKRKLVRNAAKLHVGDSYDKVIATLGKPNYDQRTFAKESPRLIGRSLKYYAVRWDADLVNERHDQLVRIWLDPQDRVRNISIRITQTR
jgi:N-acyl-D-aspartate/D-glutamate deacylase